MAIYTVHSKVLEPRESLASIDSLKLVEEGFCWPAFFVPVLWLLAKRMWIVAIIALAWFIGLAVVAEQWHVPEYAAPLGTLALSVVMGFEGKRLYRWSLKRRGYRFIGLTAGADRAEAELRFFYHRPLLAEAI